MINLHDADSGLRLDDAAPSAWVAGSGAAAASSVGGEHSRGAAEPLILDTPQRGMIVRDDRLVADADADDDLEAGRTTKCSAAETSPGSWMALFGRAVCDFGVAHEGARGYGRLAVGDALKDVAVFNALPRVARDRSGPIGNS
jgi:hypothetical protein